MNVCPMCQYEESIPFLAPDQLTRDVCEACVREMKQDIIAKYSNL